MPNQEIKKQEDGLRYEMTSVLLRFLKEEKSRKAPDYSQIEIPVKHLKRTSFTYKNNMSPVAGAFITKPKYDISLSKAEICIDSIYRADLKTSFEFTHRVFAARDLKTAVPIAVFKERKAHFAVDSKKMLFSPQGIKNLTAIPPERAVLNTSSALERMTVPLTAVVTSYAHAFCRFGDIANAPKKLDPLPKRITEIIKCGTLYNDISFNSVSVPKGIGSFARFTKPALAPVLPNEDIRKIFSLASMPQIKKDSVFFHAIKSINEIKTFDSSVFEHRRNVSPLEIGVQIVVIGEAVHMREKVSSLLPHFEKRKMRPVAPPKIPPKPDFSGAYRDIKDSLKL